MEITKLESVPRGPPFLLGKEMDMQVQEYIKSLWESGGVVNSKIVMAEGIVKSHDNNLLQENGGHIVLSKSWEKSVLGRMGYVKRRASIKVKVIAADFDVLKTQFVFDIRTIVEIENIPPNMIINWDHTGIHYVPVSNWTSAKEGSERVEIGGAEDKRQITAVFVATMSGNCLPLQVGYAGKTKKCIPSVKFPDDCNWLVTHTKSHWTNERTTQDYIKLILLPYVPQTRKDLSLPEDHLALVILDRFKGQCILGILFLLDSYHFQLTIVPANCTDRLQPLDILVNKPAKNFLRSKFQQWYSEEVRRQIGKGQDVKVDLSMSIVKPIGVWWLMDLNEYMKSNPSIIINGFKHILKFLILVCSQYTL